MPHTTELVELFFVLRIFLVLVLVDWRNPVRVVRFQLESELIFLLLASPIVLNAYII